jgi:hypothetical protein
MDLIKDSNDLEINSEDIELSDDSLMPLIMTKILQIKNNLMELINDLNEYQNDLSKHFCGKVLIPESILNAMNDLIPKIKSNISIITTKLDKSLAEKNSLKLDLNNCLRRQLKYKKESEFLRNWNKELTEEREWDKTCNELMISETINQKTIELLNSYPIIESILLLIWKITENNETLKTCVDPKTEPIFKPFLSTIISIMKRFIRNESKTDEEIRIVITICGIITNIFVSSSSLSLVSDVNELIECLIHIMTKSQTNIDLNKHSLMALFNISLNTEGLQVLLSKKGFIKELAQNFLKSNFKLDFESRIVSLKLIQLLINNSNENKLSLFEEMVEVLPIKRLQHILSHDMNWRIRQECAQLLASVGGLEQEV